MKCEKCKHNINPRDEIKVECGYADIVEVSIQCPKCGAHYSTWIKPEQWNLQE